MVPCARCGKPTNPGDHRCAICNATQPPRPFATAAPWTAHPLRAGIATVLYAALVIWLVQSGFLAYVGQQAWLWLQMHAHS